MIDGRKNRMEKEMSEKELGFSGKLDIEKYGIKEFNQKCRESVWKNEEAFRKRLWSIC